MKNILFLLVFLVSFSGCKKAEEAPADMAISAVKLPAKEESAASSLYEKSDSPAADQKLSNKKSSKRVILNLKPMI